MSMASTFPTAGFVTPGLKFLVGSFRPNGSSAVVASSAKGRGYSVAYTSTGLFTVTFNQVGYSLVGFFTSLRTANATATGLQWTTAGTYTAASKTITIKVCAADGTLADPPASNADNVISFLAIFSDVST
jgi:hypothetical protein